MSRESLVTALAAGEELLLDTSCLIAYLSGEEAVSPVAAHVLDQLVASGRNPALVSPVTIMEVLVGPLRHPDRHALEYITDFLHGFPNLRVVPIDGAVAEEAARLRAWHDLRPPDALIVATGVVARVDHLISNDVEWTRRLRNVAAAIKVCHLGDHLPFP